MTEKQKTSNRRYLYELFIAFIFYFVILIPVTAGQPAGTGYQGTAQLLWLLPIIPVLAIFVVIIRYYRRMDEFYQRVTSEAFALGALIWGLMVMAWGFAENAGAPVLPTIIMAPALGALWGLCTPIILRRYK